MGPFSYPFADPQDSIEIVYNFDYMIYIYTEETKHYDHLPNNALPHLLHTKISRIFKPGGLLALSCHSMTSPNVLHLIKIW